MQSLDELWRQVVEAPDDVGLRLVLADALIEQGDPRGELIALQCRGADARVVVDGDALVENVAERVNELVADNWERWLGDLAHIAVRQGSTYRDGMLFSVQVGDTTATTPTWQRVAKHRELCAVQRVRPFKARAEPYGAFLAALVHDPAWVEISAPDAIRILRLRRKRWGIRQIRYGGIAYWRDDQRQRGVLTSEIQMLSEIAVDIETFELSALWLGEEMLDVMTSLQRLFPKLAKVRVIDRFANLRRHGDPAVRARVEALSIAEIVDDDD